MVEKFENLKIPFALKVDYDMDSKEGRIIIKVIDVNSGQVVNQIPPKNEADLHKRLSAFLGVNPTA